MKNLKEECGVVAISGNPESAKLVKLALHALQHRGQESAGIVTDTGKKTHSIHKDKGLVSEAIPDSAFDQLIGKVSIGHVRYSTTGSNRAVNAQPISIKYKCGALSIAHNGNFTNAIELRSQLENKGAIFNTSNDTEILIHLIAQHHGNRFKQSFLASLMELEGAYSIVALHNDTLYAIRDPKGIRPLYLGEMKDGTQIVASESCAFDIIGASFVRPLDPGELLIIKGKKVTSEQAFPKKKKAFCIFEYIYIMRPDSLTRIKKKDISVADLRFKLGQKLAEEHPVKADVVIDVPDSSKPAAIGYADALGISYRMGLVRSHYIGRTFIQPEQEIRDFNARLKYNVVKSVVEGKRVVIIDDSIVRGTTSRKIVNMMRDAGAKSVAFLSTAPIWKFPCFYGVDTPDPEELIAAKGDEKAIQKWIGCDYLGYLSIEGMRGAFPNCGYCTACFDGDYPAGYPSDFDKEALED